MAEFNNSVNMNLPIPSVGEASGPAWASLLNNSLTLLDSHSHQPGYGVPITTAAINIDGDLALNSNNLTLARSLRLNSNVAPLAEPIDLLCLYASGANLYYNDSLGNQIQITSGGALAAAPGNIANLTAPASASYVSGSETFVFQSDSNTAANMDVRNLILRNLAASSFGLTVQPPASMPANYSITLPTLPAATSFMTMAPTGTQAATIPVSLGITRPMMESVNLQITPAASTSITAGAGEVTVLSLAITTTGRPVMVNTQAPLGGAPAFFRMQGQDVTDSVRFRVRRNGVIVQYIDLVPVDNAFNFTWPPSVMSFVDTPAGVPNAYTFTVQQIGAGTLVVQNMTLAAREL